MVFENATIASPKAVIPSENALMSFSPMIFCAHPPERGIDFWSSASTFPAFAATVTESPSTLPFVAFENATTALP